MKIYVAILELHDFLTFSSSVGFATIGGVTYPVYRPQPYIHNYALMYGLSGIPYASLASLAGEFHRIRYSVLDEIETRLYAYPARPRSLAVKRVLGNIRGEGYVSVQPRPKSVYPWHVAHIYIAPGSVFETVVVVRDEGTRLPKTIRIGVKRQGVFRVEYLEGRVEGCTNGYSDPINLGDVIKAGMKPDSYVTLLATKTEREDTPYSNYIVKGFYRERRLSVIRASDGKRVIEFKLPLAGGGCRA